MKASTLISKSDLAQSTQTCFTNIGGSMISRLRSTLCSALLIFSLTASSTHATTALVDGHQLGDTETWATRQQQIAFNKILANISRSDGAKGSVVAAPSHSDPDYYYHWVRDAALTMDTIVTIYQSSRDERVKDQLANILMDYISFSRANQQTQTLTGLGEPKFYLNGAAYNDPWGRPQNDSPALRAVTATHLAFALIQEGQLDYVKKVLYDGAFPSSSLIKTDLEYVASHWRDSSFDLWEEVKADHFYTRMVQRRALVEGAQLARILGDAGAAQHYQTEATLISQDLGRFLRSDSQSIVASLNRVEGVNYKNSNLDVAVLLGVLHGNAGDGFLPASSPWVLNTAQKLISSFAQLYPVNRDRNVPGVAIGRYPEDRYSGSGFNGGNPWVLTTAAAAEIFYKASVELKRRDPKISAQYRALGDQYLQRIQYHSNPDGSMSEQWDKNSGYMTSAPDLTWSYASFLTLMKARAAAR
jgi:glucoamylase